MALTKIGATLGGSADVIQVTQSSHGLSLGYPVKVSGNGTYAHATADSATNAEAIGIIIATTTDTMTIALGGRITIDGVLPSGNLPAGTTLFVPVSAGKLSATEPSGNNEVSKPMAVITYLNSEMIMIQQRGEVISTTGITLADDAVTNAKLANMATRTVKANATSGSANPTDVVMADGDFLIANGSGLVTVPIAGDVAVSNTGAAVIQTGAVDIAMLSASNHDNARFLRGDNTWQAAGGAIAYVATAIRFANDQTGEQTTTSTSAVPLIDISSLSIGQTIPVVGRNLHRKAAGVLNQGGCGLTVNAVIVGAPTNGNQSGENLCGSNGGEDSIASGDAVWSLPHIATNYDRAGGMGQVTSKGSGFFERTVATKTAARPNASMTSITITGLTTHSTSLVGADEFHLYTVAVS